ncbi:hypothetical protein T4D_13391 [Trichinella pseudospiralis]|uniref:Uncharacterized protein n=1 Tax=Trichinella pseudospiralis TaxID=6337 RepID=A0A0V1G1P3_TRIPS|nr:hypothetical protein T4D_13391 [Trichinella pseudospiralis]
MWRCIYVENRNLVDLIEQQLQLKFFCLYFVMYGSKNRLYMNYMAYGRYFIYATNIFEERLEEI